MLSFGSLLTGDGGDGPGFEAAPGGCSNDGNAEGITVRRRLQKLSLLGDFGPPGGPGGSRNPGSEDTDLADAAFPTLRRVSERISANAPLQQTGVRILNRAGDNHAGREKSPQQRGHSKRVVAGQLSIVSKCHGPKLS